MAQVVEKTSEQAIRDKMPKNNSIFMSLSEKECAKIASQACVDKKTTTAQAKTFLRTGIAMQPLIDAVSNHIMEEDAEFFGDMLMDAIKPSLDECMRFINRAVKLALKNDN